MSERNMAQASKRSALSPASGDRRPYTPPLVRKLGDIRCLTLGGSAGADDSGAEGTEEPPM